MCAFKHAHFNLKLRTVRSESLQSTWRSMGSPVIPRASSEDSDLIARISIFFESTFSHDAADMVFFIEHLCTPSPVQLGTCVSTIKWAQMVEKYTMTRFPAKKIDIFR